jgi:type IV pilus biogenesis protein CpaD/CtpE
MADPSYPKITPAVEALIKRASRARSFALKMQAFSGSDPANAAYWVNKSREMDQVADGIEMQIQQAVYGDIPGKTIEASIIRVNFKTRKRA